MFQNILTEKSNATQGFDLTLEAGLALEKYAQAIVFESKDKLEGTTAFLEKRKANYTGK